MVPRAGVEPARPFGQRILSPQRLPFRHPGTRAVKIAFTPQAIQIHRLRIEDCGLRIAERKALMSKPRSVFCIRSTPRATARWYGAHRDRYLPTPGITLSFRL